VALGYSSAAASVGSVISYSARALSQIMGGWQLPFAIYGVAFALLALAAISIPKAIPRHPFAAVAAVWIGIDCDVLALLRRGRGGRGRQYS